MGKKTKSNGESPFAFSTKGSLIDTDAMAKIGIAHMAREIRERIETGASKIDIENGYAHKTLQETLAYFRIADRSKLTCKEDMAARLVQVFGDGSTREDDSKLSDRKISVRKTFEEYEKQIETLTFERDALKADLKEYKKKKKDKKKKKKKDKKDW